ncbi:MAG TPA: hypothetical protein DD726_00705 [Phycisphaerales bacterium]|nr:hypothetical protein [Phycisphaerales bacterium]
MFFGLPRHIEQCGKVKNLDFAQICSKTSYFELKTMMPAFINLIICSENVFLIQSSGYKVVN